MRTFFITLVSVIMLLGTAITAIAAPAYPYPIEVSQPDGTTLTIRLQGDEWFNYTTTDDGYIVVKNQQNFYVYSTVSQAGEIIPTNRIARNANVRNSADANFLKSIDINSEISRLYNAKNAAASKSGTLRSTMQNEPQKASWTGSPKALVILVNFSDKSFVSPASQSDFTNLCNQTGYSVNGATGSVKDWFKASSYGKFAPDFVVVGPYTLSNTMEYYGMYDTKMTSEIPAGYSNAPNMIVEACSLAKNAGLNFAQFDYNSDGYIDNVFVVYAGYNEAEGGVKATVWPHRWAVQGNNYSGSLSSRTFDGKIVNAYACTSELKGNSGSTMAAIGTFVHEFGHVVGLPDYYQTDDSSIPALGAWSVMASGNYNNQSRTPPVYSAYDRFFLGWFTPEELTVTGQKTLSPLAQVTTPPANTNGQAYLFAASAPHNMNGATPNPNEFFILEYREKTGWDAYLPAAGMFIWHIDYNATAWSQNVVNNYSGVVPQTAADHMRVYIEPLNNSITYAPSAFTSGNFNPVLWNGTDIQRPITNITKNGTTSMTFNVTFPVAGPPVATAATNVQRTTFTTNWNPSSGAGSYQLSVYYKNGATKMYDGGGFQDKTVSGATWYDAAGLDRTKATIWYYTVKAVSGGVPSAESNEIAVTLANFDGVSCDSKSNIQAGENPTYYWSIKSDFSHYAEYYHLADIAKVTGCRINIYQLQNNSSNPNYAKITVKIWKKGNDGLPGSVLYSEDFAFSKLKTGINDLTFSTPTIVPADFFIGYQYYVSPSNPDVFNLLSTNIRGVGGLNTAYLYDVSWGWFAMSDYYYSKIDGDFTMSFYIFPNVCTFAPEASFTANTSNSPVVFTNTSVEAPGTAWYWAFGDGQSSTDKNPTHAYSAKGTYTVTLTASNLVGESVKSQQITVNFTALPAIAQEVDANIYPNPVKRGETLVIHCDELQTGSTLSLYNISGQLVLNEKITGTNVQKTMDFAPGIYLLQIKNQTQSFIRKIIIK